MREFTGRKVFFFTAACFGVVIAVNVVMATKAVSTFPGLEVANSYVASQSFDADRSAQIGLGWTLTPEYDPQAQKLRLNFTDANGMPSEIAQLSVLVGRSTEARDDLRPEFRREAGVFVADANLSQGKWMMQIEAIAPDGTPFRQRIDLFVKG
jgi:nitrogen fixation protein FixH